MGRFFQKRFFLPVKWRLAHFAKVQGFVPVGPTELLEMREQFDLLRISLLQEGKTIEAQGLIGKIELIDNLLSYGKEGRESIWRS